MTGVPLTGHFDVIVRRKSMQRVGLSTDTLAQLLEAREPIASDRDLIVAGPSFGDDAAHEFRRRLQEAGLKDVDDFLILSVDLPEWAALRVEAVPT